MSESTIRSRWAAIGAAVAVSLGAGGIGISHATSDSGDGPVSAFFPIEPCRLAENAGIGADSSIVLDGWGATGTCNLPDGITGLAANVTAVGASQQTNLRFYAHGDPVPGTANLNPSPGAAPTPNAVNITLNTTNGRFGVYNRFGSVGVYIDVMGYYDNHTHDDRYYEKDETYTRADVDAAIAAVEALQPFTVSESFASTVELTGGPDLVESVSFVAPTSGQALAMSTLGVDSTNGTENVNLGCAIERVGDEAPVGLNTPNSQFVDFDVDHGFQALTLSGHRVFDVAAGEAVELGIYCGERLGIDGGRVRTARLTATFTPD